MNPYIKGENNPKARLTVEKVRNARIEYELYKGVSEPKPGKHNNRAISAVKLAKKYRVSASTMWGLLARKTWRFVSVAIVLPLLFSGCRGLDRLMGEKDDDPAPVAAPAPLQILGAWAGELFSGQVLINGGVIDADIAITSQTDGAVSGTWVLSVEQSDQPEGPPPIIVAQGTLTGTVDAVGAFSYAIIESETCNQGTATGTATGSTMTVTWTGQSGCDFWFTGTGELSK
jgi:hypothetical protein